MREYLQIGLVLAGLGCLVMFGSFLVETRMDGTAEQMRTVSRVEIGQPWLWYRSRSEEVTRADGAATETSEWRVIASPTWAFLPAAAGLFLLAHRLRPRKTEVGHDRDQAVPPRADVQRP
jgi:hypothetical protein